jgi:Terpene synthase family 2, C-terminal metal binding
MHTGGLASWAASLDIANGIELSPAQAGDPAVRALREAWSTFALLLNDLMSFAKEARNADTSSNILTVLAHERGCTPPEAVPEAYAICDRIATLFRALCAQVRAGARADETLDRHLASLEHSWRGILEWGFRAPRYATGGDPHAPLLQTFPGWADEPADGRLEPLPYASIAWWWDELERRPAAGSPTDRPASTAGRPS